MSVSFSKGRGKRERRQPLRGEEEGFSRYLERTKRKKRLAGSRNKPIFCSSKRGKGGVLDPLNV